jgi:hypothetical protein
MVNIVAGPAEFGLGVELGESRLVGGRAAVGERTSLDGTGRRDESRIANPLASCDGMTEVALHPFLADLANVSSFLSGQNGKGGMTANAVTVHHPFRFLARDSVKGGVSRILPSVGVHPPLPLAVDLFVTFTAIFGKVEVLYPYRSVSLHRESGGKEGIRRMGELGEWRRGQGLCGNCSQAQQE